MKLLVTVAFALAGILSADVASAKAPTQPAPTSGPYCKCFLVGRIIFCQTCVRTNQGEVCSIDQGRSSSSGTGDQGTGKHWLQCTTLCTAPRPSCQICTKMSPTWVKCDPLITRAGTSR